MKDNIKTLLKSLFELIVASPAILGTLAVLTLLSKVGVTITKAIWGLW